MNREQPVPDQYEYLEKVMAWENPLFPAPGVLSLQQEQIDMLLDDVAYATTLSQELIEEVLGVIRDGAHSIPAAAEENLRSWASAMVTAFGDLAPAVSNLVLDAYFDEPPPEPESLHQRALPRPSHQPPMWANNPTRTRRTRNRATNVRTPRI